MRFRVEWTDTARSDLDAVLDYIARDCPNAAVSVFGRVVQAAGRLDAMPLRGRVVPELARVGVCDFRELVVSPWRFHSGEVGGGFAPSPPPPLGACPVLLRIRPRPPKTAEAAAWVPLRAGPQ
jgi:plasmid stabilization system protein ParE